MDTALYVVVAMVYVISAVALFGSALFGKVSTKNVKNLIYTLVFFVLIPWSFMYVEVLFPLAILFAVGYGIVCLGMAARSTLIKWKEQIVEELRKNLTD